jgi:tRNA dimethylallyltransferase
MDVGTAKPTLIERRGIPHHLVDVADPGEDFTVAEFAATGRRLIREAGCPLVISGGSGLHFRSLVDPMSFAPTDPMLRSDLEAQDLASLVDELLRVDPSAVLHVDMANKRRVVRALEIEALTGETPSRRATTAEAEDLRRYVPVVGFTAIGLDPGDRLDDRVDQRLDMMRSGGLVEEVARLWGRMGRNARTAVGYREIAEYLGGEVSEQTAFVNAARATRRLARKQRTWFQRDPRIRWIPWLEDADDRASQVLEALS